MKKIIATLVFATVFVSLSYAQKVKTVKLTQTEGVFEKTEVKLKAGTYVFEVSNNGVDHALGFVLAPKGTTDQKDHIQAAYLEKTVADGETASSKEVELKKGEYEYFCPLNPTPRYLLTVR